MAARYAPNASPPDYKVKDDEHYAEVRRLVLPAQFLLISTQLWMGTHSTNPSKIYGTDQLLSVYLSDKKDLLGSASGFEAPFDGHKAEEGHVPFLFKILCANQGQQSCQNTMIVC